MTPAHFFDDFPSKVRKNINHRIVFTGGGKMGESAKLGNSSKPVILWYGSEQDGLIFMSVSAHNRVLCDLKHFLYSYE